MAQNKRDFAILSKRLEKEKRRLISSVENFREVKNQQGQTGISTDELILREILEVRFEIQDLKKTNRKIKLMMSRFKKGDEKEGSINEFEDFELSDDSDIGIQDSIHISQLGSKIKKVLDARKRKRTLLGASRDSRSVMQSPDLLSIDKVKAL